MIDKYDRQEKDVGTMKESSMISFMVLLALKADD